ncbi:MAG: peptidoglycan editing factor PgeF [Halarsenatibacteraceae bacterium]
MKIKNYRLIFSLKGTNDKLLINSLNEKAKRVIQTNQIHSSIIFHLQANKSNITDLTIKADGIISADRDTIIRTVHADCLPIYFIDIKEDVFALIHSGWKGTLKKIASKTLKEMVRNYKLNISNIKVVIGPGIDQKNYQVGSEIFLNFKSSWNIDLDFFEAEKVNNKYRLDLKEANKRLLIDSGLPAENIYVSKLSTFNSENLFESYRRDGETAGRMAAYIYKVRSST